MPDSPPPSRRLYFGKRCCVLTGYGRWMPISTDNEVTSPFYVPEESDIAPTLGAWLRC